MISLKRLILEITEETSELDASVRMLITRKGDGIYKKVKHIFSQHGEAFLDIESRKIFVDGEEADRENWTREHFLFVQAHEIAHLRLNHTPENRDETMADYKGILILLDKGFKDAAKLGIKQFKYRNGMSFKEYRSKLNEK